MVNVRTRVYVGGRLEAEGFPLEQVSDVLERPDTIVWVDFCGPTREQLDELAHELGIHELAVEDALDPHQRPKLDHYDTHLFVACHAVRMDMDSGELQQTEINVFFNHRWLITVRKNEAFSIDQAVHRWDRSPALTRLGVGFLLHGILDTVVDGYFDTLQDFDQYYDDVSDQIFSETPLEPAQERRWFQMRQSLVRFHRLAGPLREVVSTLMRREIDSIPDALQPYYQDVYDHILRVSESTDALRDLVATIVETNLSLRDYRQNQIVKQVSSWAAIVAVPALITGYYGMNVPFPGAGTTEGFVVSTLLIAGISGGLYAVFRRNNWL